jgi:hypothetical protein
MRTAASGDGGGAAVDTAAESDGAIMKTSALSQAEII